MIVRRVNSFGVKPEQMDITVRLFEDVTIISARAPFAMRLLGAWTAVFGPGLARFISRRKKDVYIAKPRMT